MIDGGDARRPEKSEPTFSMNAFVLKHIDTLPANIGEFISEISIGLGDIYGTAAARQYHETAREKLQEAFDHPAVDPIAVFSPSETAVGLLLPVKRGAVGQIALIHVLEPYLSNDIETILIREAVEQFRNSESTEGILSESVTLCPLNLDPVHRELGFEITRRVLMAADLDHPALDGAPSNASAQLRSHEVSDTAQLMVNAYVNHPGRKHHYEVRNCEDAALFLTGVRQDAYGACRESYCRLIKDRGKVIAAIIGCEVAPDTGFILHVMVEPSFQGQGLGTQLVTELAAHFREAGLTRIALGVTASNPAKRLYHRLGFEGTRSINAYHWWRA